MNDKQSPRPNCDCLNDCGDDPALERGEVEPCDLHRRKCAAYVPDPKDFAWTARQNTYFTLAQKMLQAAIDEEGLEMGASCVLSGVTRELRRHLPVEEVARALRGLADTMAQVAQYDVNDEPDHG